MNDALPIGEPVFSRYGCTYEDQKRLTFWAQEDGWCSGCGRPGGEAEGCTIAHVGVPGKASIGFCARCVQGLVAASGEDPNMARAAEPNGADEAPK